MTLVPKKGSDHKEYSITYHSKVMNDTAFLQTDRAKNICLISIDAGKGERHKINKKKKNSWVLLLQVSKLLADVMVLIFKINFFKAIPKR